MKALSIRFLATWRRTGSLTTVCGGRATTGKRSYPYLGTSRGLRHFPPWSRIGGRTGGLAHARIGSRILWRRGETNQ